MVKRSIGVAATMAATKEAAGGSVAGLASCHFAVCSGTSLC